MLVLNALPYTGANEISPSQVGASSNTSSGSSNGKRSRSPLGDSGSHSDGDRPRGTWGSISDVCRVQRRTRDKLTVGNGTPLWLGMRRHGTAAPKEICTEQEGRNEDYSVEDGVDPNRDS